MVVFAACESEPGPAPEAGAPVAWDAAAVDGAGLGAQGGEGGAVRDAGRDADAADGGQPAPGNPRPVGAPPFRIVPGEARLVGSSFAMSSCSHQVPASGDRWCAFYRPSARLGLTELWVLNVTKAAAGMPVRCDGTDPSCLLLTQDLWTGRPMAGPRHPTAHRFTGDTLIFHSGAGVSAGAGIFQGSVFAWRPGWAAARRISTAKGLTCVGHPKAAVARCLDNVTDDPDAPFGFDLLAGPLSDRPDATLPKVARIFPLGENDETRWSAEFSPDGSTFLWSSPPTPNAPEVITIAAAVDLADPTKRWTIEEPPRGSAPGGAARARVTGDGKTVLYLRDYNYEEDEGSSSGTLMAADLATGRSRVVLADDVGDYLPLGLDGGVDRGVLMYRGFDRWLASKLDWIGNAASPGPISTIITDTFEVVVSRDDKYVFARRDVDGSGRSDAWVVEVGPSPTPCALEARPLTTLYGHPFLESAGLVLWIEDINPASDTGQGFVASAADCSGEARFGTRVDLWFSAPTDGFMVVTDDVVNDTATLKVAHVSGSDWAGTGFLDVHKQIDRNNVGLVGPDLAVAAFTVWGAETAANGLYVAPLKSR